MNILRNENDVDFSSGFYSFVNPYSFRLIVNNSKHNPELINDIKYGFDGISLVKLHNLFSRKNNEVSRISFDDTSLASPFFEHCKLNRLKIALVGSKKEVSLSAKKIVSDKYGVHVGFVSHGFLNDYELEDVVSEVLKHDAVVVSMGTPLQENFLISLKARGWKGVGFTCGGFLDQLVSSDGKSYYPNWVNKFNIRWAYRMLKEPKRLWKRYVLIYPRGVFHYFKYMRVVNGK
ncbi:WecB/TagA/CpsF family glycosyltransferase [Modicisalibacter xianhensis]|uniref:N-acetylglucosaminyldiphosphoundecaprenol N-acetyl-beta-D-mannosaminyltransferase n=1 Tax=Modicisalibacter xianhensis TaxID=442341 RepID=A0A1I2ZD75_9GAMM|nr:WecB/TagA/CpsF family glycosyltransferase [Halomonas xianhensis]SFH35509.1 N-acetylglucosaminyldiphosphoundecaprenol N-acetyl-beta-D-mannosaminyltransferase [Halomonas xianhensis]